MVHPKARQAKAWRKILTAALCLFVLLCCGRFPLTMDDSARIRHLDAVVVLAGKGRQDAARLSGGVRLFQDHAARYLILPLRHSYLHWDWFVRRYGLPESVRKTSVVIGSLDDDIYAYLECCGGTYAEAIKTYQLVSRLPVRQFAVVSSGYHLLRVKMAFSRVFNDKSYRIFYVPEDRGQGLDLLWWTSGPKLRAVFQEYKKLAGGYFLYKPYRP